MPRLFVPLMVLLHGFPWLPPLKNWSLRETRDGSSRQNRAEVVACRYNPRWRIAPVVPRGFDWLSKRRRLTRQIFCHATMATLFTTTAARYTVSAEMQPDVERE